MANLHPYHKPQDEMKGSTTSPFSDQEDAIQKDSQTNVSGRETASNAADTSVKEKAGKAAQAVKQRASESVESVKETAAKASEAVKEKAAEIGKSTQEGYQKAVASVADKYETATHKVKEGYDATSSQVEDSFKEHPLVFTAGALAAGFLLGLAIPQSRREKRAVSSTADTIREKGEELVERSKEAVKAGTESAKEALKERHLDSEGLRESAQYVGHEAADAAKESF